MADWQSGDLAVCIHDGRWMELIGNGIGHGPRAGDLLRVDYILRQIPSMPEDGVWLTFLEFPLDCYPSSAFRKVEPDAAPAEDAEIVSLITGRPLAVPA